MGGINREEVLAGMDQSLVVMARMEMRCLS
jgi:hypothetical protein